MKREARLRNNEFSFPVEFIEIHGPGFAEEKQIILEAYHELYDNVFCAETYLYGAALFILLTYVIYHVISKVRGNEKNGPMNNYGL